MTTIDDLKNRRSIRKYKKEQIKDEELKQILDAGIYAPTGAGRQSPKIVVIQDKEKIEEYSEWNKSFFPDERPDEYDPFFGAPTLIIVLADKNIPTHVYDGSAVLTNIVNAAYSIGVGSCWVFRAKQEFESEKGQKLLKEWGISSDYEGIGHVVLGYSDENPKPHPRKDDYITYVD